jgi:hypothetical protein
MRLKHLAIAAFVLWPVMFPASAEAWTITVTGTIYSDLLIGPSPLNGTGIFGTPGISLVGSRYFETITTDPQQSTQLSTSPSYIERNGGPTLGGSGAPYLISTTVNGFT